MSRARVCLFVLAVLPVPASVDAAVPPGAKCAAAKQKAAVKKVGAKLKCYQKAAATGEPVDADCLATAESKFNAAVAKAESKGGCVRTGDAAAIESAADRCISDIGNETPSEPPTCGTTAYPECGGSCPAGQQCQAIISTRTGGGCGIANTCATSCACRAIATACNGSPCDQVCRRNTTCMAGDDTTTESCCSGRFGPCNTSGSPACCCSASCLSLAEGAGTCQSGLACDVSGTASVCVITLGSDLAP